LSKSIPIEGDKKRENNAIWLVTTTILFAFRQLLQPILRAKYYYTQHRHKVAIIKPSQNKFCIP